MMMTSYASEEGKQLFCLLGSRSFRHLTVHVCIVIDQKHLFKHRANTVTRLHLHRANMVSMLHLQVCTWYNLIHK